MAKRTGVMLAKKLTETYLARMPEQVYFQPKLNGQRCRVEFIGKDIYLMSSQGNVINAVPHINEQLRKISCAITFDGELWHPDLSFQEISAIARKTTRLDKRYKMLNFYIFDIIDGYDSQWERFNLLYSYHPEERTENIKVLNWFYAPKTDWEYFFDIFVSHGYEGLIIRNPDALYQPKKTPDLLKKKRMRTGEFKITGAFQADAVQGVQTNMLGGLMLATQAGKKFNCGAGNLSHTERRESWALYQEYPVAFLIGKMALIEYPELTMRGVPHQPILKEIK